MKIPRSWQEFAFKIIDRCNSGEKRNVIPVNACVGSGKTDVASYAFGDFIVKNRNKRRTADIGRTGLVRLFF